MLYLLLFLWIGILIVFHKNRMPFFVFVAGSVGLFCFLMYSGRSNMESYLEYAVAWLTGIIGRMTGFFTAYPEYSMLTIYRGNQATSFFVDYECSGFIETLVYICLLLFYPVYNLKEKVKYLSFGFLYIFVSNVLRVFIICLITKIWGNSLFFFSHTVFARLIFFSLMIVLYYRVFTKPHILRQKVGNINYGN